MKKAILTLTAICLLATCVNAADQEIHAKSDLKEVTVFLSGASLTSKGSFSAGNGTQDIVFENLSPSIDPNSIQASGDGDFTILGVFFRTNYLLNQPKPKEILAFEDSLEGLQYRCDGIRNQRQVYEIEQSMLIANKNIGGQNTGVNAAELEKVANILRTRLSDLVARIQESQLKEKKIQNSINSITQQLTELNNKRNKNTGEIVVSIYCKTPVQGKMALTYNVPNAGWSPVYDIRANAAATNVTLEYRAMILQNTGVDWNNVKLSLCTGNPSLPGTQPTLNPWWLSYYQTYHADKKAYGAPAPAATRSAMSMSETIVLEDMSKNEEQAADYAWEYTEVSEGQTSITYDISIPYSIGSDNKAHAVPIQNFTIPASFKYFAIPKLDKDAFLLAELTGWDKYNLLSGNINIFFDETFVGKSYLNTQSTNDTLAVSLGRDKNIVINRTLMKDKSEKKLMGLVKKETKFYEIEVRNKKKTAIDIEILDQIPLSKIADIEVESLETSGARYDKETGKVTWKMKLGSTEEKKVRLGFSIKYPKDKVINGL